MDCPINCPELSTAHHIINKYLVHLADVPFVNCREGHLLNSFLLTAP